MDNEYLKGEFKTNIFQIETDDRSPFSSDSLILTTVERGGERGPTDKDPATEKTARSHL